jgi:2-oxoglutarate ferredoxin oxidoreductase subunit alpha
MNLGQLSLILRAEYLLDCVPLNKVQGLPFRVDEVERKIHELIEGC